MLLVFSDSLAMIVLATVHNSHIFPSSLPCTFALTFLLLLWKDWASRDREGTSLCLTALCITFSILSPSLHCSQSKYHWSWTAQLQGPSPSDLAYISERHKRRQEKVIPRIQLWPYKGYRNVKECVGEAILKKLPVVGGRQVGKSPALPNKPSSLEWETAMTLNTKLSVKKWAILPLFVTCQGRFSNRDGGKICGSYLPLSPNPSLYMIHRSLTSDFGLKRINDPVKIGQMGKGKLKQYKSENSYFNPTLSPSLLLPLHCSTSSALASLSPVICYVCYMPSLLPPSSVLIE